MRALVVSLLIAMAVTTGRAQAPQGSVPPLPPRLQRYVDQEVALSAADQRRLLGGRGVAHVLDAHTRDDIAVFAAIWIDAPIGAYLDGVADIERFERGGIFKVTKRISPAPRREDFAQLHLPQQDVSDLRRCRIGDCSVKLDAPAIARFRRDVEWHAADEGERADGLMQQVVWETATAYLEGGDQRLGTYRDGSEPTVVAEELTAMIQRLPELTSRAPDVRRHLLEYPRHLPPGTTSFLYWQQLEFGLRPTIRLSHLMICRGETDAVVVSKTLYASHYFRAALEVRALLPHPARGAGFWLVTVTRSRADGLRGVAGFFVRRRVRAEVQQRALAGLEATKRTLERQGRR